MPVATVSFHFTQCNPTGHLHGDLSLCNHTNESHSSLPMYTSPRTLMIACKCHSHGLLIPEIPGPCSSTLNAHVCRGSHWANGGVRRLWQGYRLSTTLPIYVWDKLHGVLEMQTKHRVFSHEGHVLNFKRGATGSEAVSLGISIRLPEATDDIDSWLQFLPFVFQIAPSLMSTSLSRGETVVSPQ